MRRVKWRNTSNSPQLNPGISLAQELPEIAIESQFYPLGSCTMKYNPKVNEGVARLPGFAQIHPLAPVEILQGAMELLYDLEQILIEISGMDCISLQPSAGAQGELTGLMLIRACLTEKGNPRKKIIVPDTAHGTNPASSTLCGYDVVQISSTARGVIDTATVAKVMDEDVAAIMITNPNTLGFRKGHRGYRCSRPSEEAWFISTVRTERVMGVAKPGHMGVDVLHMNLHKTFSTPHGGGGPGAGPVAVKEGLSEYLPVPRIVKRNDKFELLEDCPKSIGRVRSFFGNFGILVRAYTYIISLGGEGLEESSRNGAAQRELYSQEIRKAIRSPIVSRACTNVFLRIGYSTNTESILST